MERSTTSWAGARVVAAAGVAVVDRAGRLLLVRRRDEGSWCMPAGHVEAGETWAVAAARECREESGWSVRIEGLLGVYSDPASQTHTYPTGVRVQYLSVAFIGAPLHREAQPDRREIDRVGWFDQHELPEPLFGPDVPIIADVFAGARPVIS